MISAVLIGGSITCGGNTYTEDQRWINQVFQWINTTWPHADHRLINACKPATPSMLFSFCMHQSVPDDTDLLFMEVRIRSSQQHDLMALWAVCLSHHVMHMTKHCVRQIASAMRNASPDLADAVDQGSSLAS